MDKLKEISIQFDKLAESKKIALLGYLVFYFSQAARGSYIEAGNTQDVCVSHLRAYNEVMQSISDRLLFYIEAKPDGKTYSTEAFFKILKETFEQGIENEDYFFSIVYDSFRQILSK